MLLLTIEQKDLKTVEQKDLKTVTSDCCSICSTTGPVTAPLGQGMGMRWNFSEYKTNLFVKLQ